MKKIAIIPNISKDTDLEVTKKLIACIEKNNVEVLVQKAFYKDIDEKYVRENAISEADCVIVIGGDGTILNAAFECSVADIPILGINLGRIGFMTEVEVDDIEKAIFALISGNYIIEERMMLKVSFLKQGEKKTYHALNDVVISKTDNSKLIGMDLFSGTELINRYVADGLILSTPTGSTGYNLSAGGPVVNPLMELVVATPMCAHMLTARPAVMPADEVLRVVLESDDKNCALVTVDGEIAGKIANLSEIEIIKSEYKTKIIKINKQSFYNVFTGKLS